MRERRPVMHDEKNEKRNVRSLKTRSQYERSSRDAARRIVLSLSTRSSPHRGAFTLSCRQLRYSRIVIHRLARARLPRRFYGHCLHATRNSLADTRRNVRVTIFAISAREETRASSLHIPAIISYPQQYYRRFVKNGKTFQAT